MKEQKLEDSKTWEERRIENLQLIGKMQLTSDIFFGKVLEDKAVCEEVLSILLNQTIHVEMVKAQYVIRQLATHSVILDIFAVLDTKERVNIEIHRKEDEDHVKRIRYNLACMDVEALDTGKEYVELKDVYVIYITEKDFLKSGKGIPEISRISRQCGISIPNGVREWYVNLAYAGDTKEQTAWLRYIKETCDENENIYFTKLVERVRFLKEDEGGQAIMCEIMDQLRVESEARGEARGEIRGMITMLKAMNYTLEDIVDKLVMEMGKSRKEVQELL